MPGSSKLNWASRAVRVIRAKNVLKPVFAAWSDETKNRITKEQLENGLKPVTHELLEDFDLVLWVSDAPYRGSFLHVVSLNKGEYDPFDKGIQNARIPAGKFRGQKAMMESMLTILIGWVDKYNQLLVGSDNEERLEQYARLLKPALAAKGITVRPFPEAPQLGLLLSK